MVPGDPGRKRFIKGPFIKKDSQMPHKPMEPNAGRYFDKAFRRVFESRE
jgi:hypothetical protein